MCSADASCSHAGIGRSVTGAQMTLQTVRMLTGTLAALAISSNREELAGIGHMATAVISQVTARMNTETPA